MEITKSEQIFSKEILNTQVSFCPVQEKKNNDDAFYEPCGIHTDSYDIDGIFYTGHKGNLVFAYLGMPKKASPENPVPAVVCVHGGSGKAYITWVEEWAKRGYAAIAMDLYGNGPEKDEKNPDNTGQRKHPYGGMLPWYKTAFLKDFQNAGMYQNVTNVVCAHNLMRNLPQVDSSKIGIQGVSWGGVTTTMVLGVDPRYAYGIVVYGCGHLAESKTYFREHITLEECSLLWDPAEFVKHAEIPVCYISGDADPHFSIDIISATYADTKNGRLCIEHGLSHSQPVAEKIQTVYAFADSMLGREPTFLILSGEKVADGSFTLSVTEPEGVLAVSITLYYITETELPYGGDENICWMQAEGRIANGRAEIEIPPNATFGYATVTDCFGRFVSTKYLPLV